MGVISALIWVITIATPLKTTHEPPSKDPIIRSLEDYRGLIMTTYTILGGPYDKYSILGRKT